MTDPAQEFLTEAPADRRELLRAVHDTVTTAAPELDQWVWRGKMWGGTDQTILGYGHFDYVNSSREQVRWFLIGLANQKAHVSLYVNAVRDKKYLGQLYAERLGKVKLGSASISFKKLEDVDLQVLSEMVAEAAKNPPA
ncbi:MAG TPA: DUF1801 domain-containing protein [Actinomycetota bacterium]|nr:DUF1801 domain-containing protein [Actinomycetota bacterium]